MSLMSTATGILKKKFTGNGDRAAVPWLQFPGFDTVRRQAIQPGNTFQSLTSRFDFACRPIAVD